MAKKLNELQKACNIVLKKNKRFTEADDFLTAVKKQIGDPKVRLYYINCGWAQMTGNEYWSVIDIWQENLNKRIKDIQIASAEFEVEVDDTEIYAKIIMVR